MSRSARSAILSIQVSRSLYRLADVSISSIRDTESTSSKATVRAQKTRLVVLPEYQDQNRIGDHSLVRFFIQITMVSDP